MSGWRAAPTPYGHRPMSFGRGPVEWLRLRWWRLRSVPCPKCKGHDSRAEDVWLCDRCKGDARLWSSEVEAR